MCSFIMKCTIVKDKIFSFVERVKLPFIYTEKCEPPQSASFFNSCFFSVLGILKAGILKKKKDCIKQSIHTHVVL